MDCRPGPKEAIAAGILEHHSETQSTSPSTWANSLDVRLVVDSVRNRTLEIRELTRLGDGHFQSDPVYRRLQRDLREIQARLQYGPPLQAPLFACRRGGAAIERPYGGGHYEFHAEGLPWDL